MTSASSGKATVGKLRRWVHWPTSVPSGVNPAKARWGAIALLGIVAWGLLLRVYEVGQQSYWIDEAFSVNAALGVLEDGIPHLPSGASYWRGALHTYLMSGFMALGAPTEFSARLPAVLFGVATIVMAFLLGRRVGGGPVGIAAAALTAFAEVEVAWSRQARMYQPLQFFTLFALYAYLMALERPTRRRIAMALAAMAGAVASHLLGALILLSIGLHWGVRWLRRLWRQRGIARLAWLSVLLLGAAAIVGVWVAGREHTAVSKLPAVGDSYLTAYLGYLQGSLGLVFSLGLLGLALHFRSRGQEVLLLLLALVVPVYFLSFHVKLLGFRYLYFVLPILFIGFALTFSAVVGRLRGPQLRWLGAVSVVAGAGVALAAGVLTVAPRSHYSLDSTSPQPDFKAAYAAVSAGLEDGDVIIDAWPAVGRLYLPRPPDYWPVFSVSGLAEDQCVADDGQREAYGNALCLRDLAALQRVVEANPRGVVIVDTLAWMRLAQPVRDYIAEQMTLDSNAAQMGSLGEVLVYRW